MIKLKASYSDADTILVENIEIEFCIAEKAGIIYRNLKKTGKQHFLSGAYAPSAKVIFLDYFSDDIIYSCTSKEAPIPYTNSDKFYCVVVHDDYELCVTPPIKIIGGNKNNRVDIQLDKKDAVYTPLSQIHLYMQDPKSNGSYDAIPSDYILVFHCTNINDGHTYLDYNVGKIPSSGIVSYKDECTYFSLNTDYEMDLSLRHQSDENLELAYQIFDGPVQNSTMTEVIFELDNKNGTSE